MLEAVLDSPVKERILLFLLANEGSYPREIARRFAFNLNAVLYQLQKLEKAGIVSSQLLGRTRLYSLSPDCPFRRELAALLQKAYDSLSGGEREAYSLRRRLPLPAMKPAAGPSPGAGAGRAPSAQAVKKKRRPPSSPPYRQRVETLDFSID